MGKAWECLSRNVGCEVDVGRVVPGNKYMCNKPESKFSYQSSGALMIL